MKLENTFSDYYPIQSGIPQGSVLGPFLYLIFTADIPQTDNTLIATFADDSAIMSSDSDTIKASNNLQAHLDLL